MQCSGDPSVICGGSYANSIYDNTCGKSGILCLVDINYVQRSEHS